MSMKEAEYRAAAVWAATISAVCGIVWLAAVPPLVYPLLLIGLAIMVWGACCAVKLLRLLLDLLIR